MKTWYFPLHYSDVTQKTLSLITTKINFCNSREANPLYKGIVSVPWHRSKEYPQKTHWWPVISCVQRLIAKLHNGHAVDPSVMLCRTVSAKNQALSNRWHCYDNYATSMKQSGQCWFSQLRSTKNLLLTHWFLGYVNQYGSMTSYDISKSDA